MHLTGGSNSIKNSYTQYRELGARTRAMLVSAAAAQWGVDAATLRTAKRQRDRPRRQEAGLRRTGRSRDEAAGAREGHAEGPEAVPHHRQADGAARRARQVQRPAGVRHRRPAARHAHRRGGAAAGVRREGCKSVDDSRGQGHQGREGGAAGAGGPRRRGRGRRSPTATGPPSRGATRSSWSGTPPASRRPTPRKLLASYRELAKQAGRDRKYNADVSRLAVGAEEDQRRVRLPLPGACADGAAQLHGGLRPATPPSCGWAPRCPAWTRWPPPRCWACRRRP